MNTEWRVATAMELLNDEINPNISNMEIIIKIQLIPYYDLGKMLQIIHMVQAGGSQSPTKLQEHKNALIDKISNNLGLEDTLIRVGIEINMEEYI